MTKSDLENKLKPFTDSITDGTLSTMSAIRLHLSLLLDIRKIGVPIPVILEITGCPYSPSTFSDKLSKLRKKMQDNTTKGSNQNHFINTPTQQSKEPAQEIISKTTKANKESEELEYSLDDWISNTRLSKGNIRLYRQGEKDGLTPDDFKGFKNYNNIAMIRLFHDWSKIVETPVYEWSKPKLTKEEFLSRYKN